MSHNQYIGTVYIEMVHVRQHIDIDRYTQTQTQTQTTILKTFVLYTCNFSISRIFLVNFLINLAGSVSKSSSFVVVVVVVAAAVVVGVDVDVDVFVDVDDGLDVVVVDEDVDAGVILVAASCVVVAFTSPS
jgi:hypothetical protein